MRGKLKTIVLWTLGVVLFLIAFHLANPAPGRLPWAR
jgi:hypothetical protein